MSTSPPEDPTPISYLQTVVASLPADSDKSYGVLVSSGSLNPVHRGHFTIFDVAAKFFSKYHQIEVLAGYLGASHHGYVGNKLGAEAIAWTDRYELCRLAAEEHNAMPDTLHVEADPWEGLQPYFRDYPDVRDHLAGLVARTFPNRKIVVYYLCGFDHFQKCGLITWNNCVSIARPPLDCGTISDRDELAKKGIYICDQIADEEIAGLLSDASSTELRRRRKEHLRVSDLTFVSVEAHLRKIRWLT
jgi:nicotinic acid mononucleotide adenylyltransferase